MNDGPALECVLKNGVIRWCGPLSLWDRDTVEAFWRETAIVASG